MNPTISYSFFQPSGNIPASLVTSRTSSVLLPNLFGQLAEVLGGVPGQGYDPVTRKPNGLFIGQEFENLLLQATDLSVSPWASQYTCTATAAAGTAPDGTNTLSKVQDLDPSYRSGRKQAVTVLDDLLTRVAGGFVQADTSTIITLQVAYFGGVTPLDVYVELDTTTGETTLGGPGAAACVAFGAEPFGGGVFLLWAAVTNNGTGNVSLQQAIYPSGAVSNTPVNQQLACFSWGNFIGLGTVPPMPVLTTTTAVLQDADLYQLDLDLSKFNQSQGTLVCLVKLPNPALWSQEPVLFCLDGGPTEVLQVSLGEAGHQLKYTTMASGVESVSLEQGTILAQDWLCVVVTYSPTGFTLTANGVHVASTGTGVVPSGMSRLTLGSKWDGTQQLQSYLGCFLYFPTVLTADETLELSEV